MKKNKKASTPAEGALGRSVLRRPQVHEVVKPVSNCVAERLVAANHAAAQGVINSFLAGCSDPQTRIQLAEEVRAYMRGSASIRTKAYLIESFLRYIHQ